MPAHIAASLGSMLLQMTVLPSSEVRLRDDARQLIVGIVPGFDAEDHAEWRALDHGLSPSG